MPRLYKCRVTTTDPEDIMTDHDHVASNENLGSAFLWWHSSSLAWVATFDVHGLGGHLEMRLREVGPRWRRKSAWSRPSLKRNSWSIVDGHNTRFANGGHTQVGSVANTSSRRLAGDGGCWPATDWSWDQPSTFLTFAYHKLSWNWFKTICSRWSFSSSASSATLAFLPFLILRSVEN